MKYEIGYYEFTRYVVNKKVLSLLLEEEIDYLLENFELTYTIFDLDYIFPNKRYSNILVEVCIPFDFSKYENLIQKYEVYKIQARFILSGIRIGYPVQQVKDYLDLISI
jgi:hypothetical protein